MAFIMSLIMIVCGTKKSSAIVQIMYFRAASDTLCAGQQPIFFWSTGVGGIDTNGYAPVILSGGSYVPDDTIRGAGANWPAAPIFAAIARLCRHQPTQASHQTTMEVLEESVNNY